MIFASRNAMNWKNKIYHTVSNSNINIIGRGKTDTSITQIHDRPPLYPPLHNVFNHDRTSYSLVVIIPTFYQNLIHLLYGPEVISVLVLSLMGTCCKVKLSHVLIKSEDVRFQKKMFILSSVTCLFYLTRKYNTKYGKH